MRLSDPDAGRVDDIQIARPGRLDAYQVKWGEYEDRVSLRDLITPSGSGRTASPSPIAQLADGWTRLAVLYPGRSVSVHFLMRASASNGDSFRTGRASGPVHLRAFLRHAFSSRSLWYGTGVGGPRDEWRDEIEVFEKASGLDQSQFPYFFAACHLDLGWRGRNDAGVTVAAQKRRGYDIDALADQLFALVGGDQTELRFDRMELLRRLGWQSRFDLSFKHDFPVDERLYQPVTATVDAIDEALKSFDQGYLAVVGPPGAGKSTTLTLVLRYRPHFRVVRYYAYVRGDTAQGRGEAHAFLHDLCLSIREVLPPERRSWGALPDSREELIEAFGAELGHLADDWRQSGIVTAILIDGLDHIEREQSPVRSLLNDLPPPATIPQGVMIILGTQEAGLQSQVNNLRPIRAQLDEPGRKIAMSPLGRDAVSRIATKALSAQQLLEDDHEEILRLSAGHPLARTYLLKRLDSDTQDRDIVAILAEAPRYEGDIEQEYGAYWDALEAQPEVCDLLAKIARIRGAVELDMIAALAGDNVL